MICWVLAMVFKNCWTMTNLQTQKLPRFYLLSKRYIIHERDHVIFTNFERFFFGGYYSLLLNIVGRGGEKAVNINVNAIYR